MSETNARAEYPRTTVRSVEIDTSGIPSRDNAKIDYVRSTLMREGAVSGTTREVHVRSVTVLEPRLIIREDSSVVRVNGLVRLEIVE